MVTLRKTVYLSLVLNRSERSCASPIFTVDRCLSNRFLCHSSKQSEHKVFFIGRSIFHVDFTSHPIESKWYPANSRPICLGFLVSGESPAKNLGVW